MSEMAALGRLRQDNGESKASLGYIARLCKTGDNRGPETLPLSTFLNFPRLHFRGTSFQDLF
jgi:hypothetical protein